MKYVVTRTSVWLEEDPGVPGTQKELVTFSLKGKDELREAWTVEINTLEEMHKLMFEVGEPIILFNYIEGRYGYTLPMLEIYDDYRE